MGNNVVILKWNPSFSSYMMLSFLSDMWALNNSRRADFDWSVADWEHIKEGDEVFWVKVGYGQTGIVGHGVITSDPYEGDDWSGRGRVTYYVEFTPDILLNPDAWPLLDCARLTLAMPEFEWSTGASGLVLTPAQAETLRGLWADYLARNEHAFARAREKRRGGDRIYRSSL